MIGRLLRRIFGRKAGFGAKRKYLENPAEFWRWKGRENQKLLFDGDLLQKDIDMVFIRTFMDVFRRCTPESVLEAGVGCGISPAVG
jgi:hypothetical protein